MRQGRSPYNSECSAHEASAGKRRDATETERGDVPVPDVDIREESGWEGKAAPTAVLFAGSRASGPNLPELSSIEAWSPSGTQDYGFFLLYLGDGLWESGQVLLG